jgi:glycosyltransferase involved in cell wall biosynthesis
MWMPLTFAKYRPINRIFPKLLPKSRMYFFSYPSMFAWYSGDSYICRRAIVLYTHNEQPELGSDQEQVALLNKAFKIHFFSSLDASRLIAEGLDESKVRIVNGAIDIGVTSIGIDWKSRSNLIVMASRFGYRKNPEFLFSIIKRLTDWDFLLLGRGWEAFLKEKKAQSLTNFDYRELNKFSIKNNFSSAKLFLSTSILEGGPIPLLESMYSGASPIVSNTGFAQDVILENKAQHIFALNSEVDSVETLIRNCPQLSERNFRHIQQFSWDRIARIVFEDFSDLVG